MSQPLARPPKSRRSQEERRRQTQASVLDACVEVLLDRGFSGLTTTEVAARAGVSRGALAHYFRTRDDLVIGAMEHAMELGNRTSLANAERARHTDDPIRAFIDDAERFFLDTSYVAMMQLVLASRTHTVFGKAFYDLVTEWRANINDIWLETFADVGIPREQSWQILHFTNNMLRGLALTSMWNRDKQEVEAIRKSWRKLVHEELAPMARAGSAAE